MIFRDLQLSDRVLIESTLEKDDIGWEYNFTTLFTWSAVGKMQIAECDGYYCVYATFGNKMVFMPPYLIDKNRFAVAVKEILGYAKTSGQKFVLRGLNKEQARVLGKLDYDLKTTRDDYDYVYKASNLKSLEGKTYHSKRNFVNRFSSLYDFEVVDYTSQNFLDVIGLFDEWSSNVKHKILDGERECIICALSNYDALGLKIPLLKSNGKIVAFSISAIEKNNVAHTLYEKADTFYLGAYQAINYYTANRYFNDDVLVNRQEDMGVEGLRKAKLSYNPYLLLEKYYIDNDD